MKSIIKEIIEAHEKALQPDEIEQFLKEIETSILILRFKHRNFKIEYDKNMFSKQEAMPQAAYVIALWGFLNYSEKTFGTVLDVINSFVEYDFNFLSEIDFERTASGAMRALTNAQICR